MSIDPEVLRRAVREEIAQAQRERERDERDKQRDLDIADLKSQLAKKPKDEGKDDHASDHDFIE